MKKIVMVLSLLSLGIAVIAQQTEEEKNLKTNELIGEWKIDLRPSPVADGYFQDFTVTFINDKGNNFEGLFYGSKVKDGFLNKNWDKIYFAFTTSDSSHKYFHSGYLLDGKLYGISYCPSREFTAPWTGELKKE